VLRALATVRDPELDEPITELGFVERVHIEARSVHVRLRLPTFFCAPNFTFIMAADAKRAVEELDDVDRVRVTLADHHAGGQIGAGLESGYGFEESFPDDESDGGLDEVRELFLRKAFIARQEGLARRVRDVRGISEAGLTQLTLQDLPPGPDRRRYLGRRAELGIDSSPSAPFLVTPDGRRITAEEAPLHLRFARTVAASMEGNAALCRGLLETRYALGKESRR
jgi:metal-sulfur cluster biosynthetic enzyme